MNEVECWYHFFFDRQACNNSAAYLFLAQVGSILSNYGFQAGCHPPRICTDSSCATFEYIETSNLSIADLKFVLLTSSPNSSESICHNSDPISLMRLSEQSKSFAISLYFSRCRVPRSTAACKSSRC